MRERGDFEREREGILRYRERGRRLGYGGGGEVCGGRWKKKEKKKEDFKKIIFYYYNIGPIFDQLRQYPKITKNREYYLEM